MTNLRRRVSAELPPLTAETVLRTWHAVDHLRHAIVPTFETYDFVLGPVAATMPVKHGTSSYDIDGITRASQEVFQFASTVNVLGLPAIAFPTGLSTSGLPLGLQIIGPRFSEPRLFAALRAAGFTDGPKPP